MFEEEFNDYYPEDEEYIDFDHEFHEFNEDDILDGVAELIIKEQHDLENAGNLEKELIDSKRGIIKENLKKKIHFVKMSIEY